MKKRLDEKRENPEDNIIAYRGFGFELGADFSVIIRALAKWLD